MMGFVPYSTTEVVEGGHDQRNVQVEEVTCYVFGFREGGGVLERSAGFGLDPSSCVLFF